MKIFTRILFSTLAFIFFSAEGVYSQRFNGGISGGLLASDLVGLDPFDTDFNKAGFTFGGLVNIHIAPKDLLQFELYYIQKGSNQFPDSANNFFDTFKLNLDYIEGALLYKRRIPVIVNKKPLDRIELEIGPSLGNRIRIAQESTAIGFFDDSQYKKTDFGINLGVAYYLSPNFYFDVRYFTSIIPVAKRSEVNSYYAVATWNNGDNVAFIFTLKYLFKAVEQSSAQ